MSGGGILLLLLIPACCLAACPPNRPFGHISVVGPIRYIPIGSPIPDFKFELHSCGSLTPEQCDRRNVILKWKFKDAKTSITVEGSISESEIRYPDSCEHCLLWRDTMDRSAGSLSVFPYFPSTDPTSTDLCWLSSVDSYQLGYPPAPVEDSALECVTLDYELLTCTWCNSSIDEHSKWNFTYQAQYAEEVDQCDPVEEGEKCDLTKRCCLTGCMASMYFNSRLWARSIPYNITLVRRNGYGRTEDTFVRSFREPTIRPSAVKNLTSVVHKHGMTVRWTCPSMSLNQVKLLYQLNITSVLGTEIRFYPELSKCANASRFYSYTFENLPAYVNYSVSVRARAELSKHWSRNVTVSNRTLVAVPLSNPVTRGSSYHRQADDKATVEIYYQDIPLERRGGPPIYVYAKTGYNKSYRCNNQERMCRVETAGFARDRNYAFVIDSKTKVGWGPKNTTSSFVLSPPGQGAPPPIYFAVENVDSSLDNKTAILNFTWIAAPDATDVQHHVIYYRICVSTRNCPGGLRWWTLPVNVSTYQTEFRHSDHSMNDYRFSIASEDSAQKSQGMLKWVDCIYKAGGSLPGGQVPERAPDSLQNETSLLVTWSRQTCHENEKDGRIVAYWIHVRQVDENGREMQDGHRANVTLPPSASSHLFTGLTSAQTFNVTLTSYLEADIFSESVIMSVKTPAGPLIWIPIFISIVFVSVLVLLCLLYSYRRYQRLRRSGHDFTKPEIDDPVRFVAPITGDEDYLVPELTSQLVAGRALSHSSSVSSDNEHSNEDKKLLSNRNGCPVRGPDRFMLDADPCYTTAIPLPNGHPPDHDMNGNPPWGASQSPSRGPITLVPLSTDQGEGYCRFGDPSEPNSITVSPGPGDAGPDRAPVDYSNATVAYMPRFSSTDSERPDPGRPDAARLNSAPLSPRRDEDGYLLPSSQPEPQRTLNKEGYVVNNDTYGLVSSPTSPAHSDDDVFDYDESDQGVRIDLTNHEGGGYIPKPDVPLLVYNPESKRSLLDEPADEPLAPPPVSMPSCDWPVSQGERAESCDWPAAGQERTDSLSRKARESAAPGRPDSYHDSGYVSNDSLPKPKPSSESVALSDVDEGYDDERRSSHDKDQSPSPSSPPIQTSSPSPLSHSPNGTILGYVTMDDVKNGPDDAIMV